MKTTVFDNSTVKITKGFCAGRTGRVSKAWTHQKNGRVVIDVCLHQQEGLSDLKKIYSFTEGEFEVVKTGSI
jgi:hypothetical protein